MKIFNVLVVLVATLAMVSGTIAQYDYCHFECITIYCDPYEEYCDYDCHEVCYPYRKSGGGTFGQISKSVEAQVDGTKTSLHSPVQQRPPISAHDLESSMRARTGK